MRNVCLAALISLLAVIPSHSQDANEEPWLERVRITSDPSEVEGCKHKVLKEIKIKKSKDATIERMKYQVWRYGADVVLLTEESWGKKKLTGEGFRCSFVRSVTNRSDVEGCRFISKVHAKREIRFSEMLQPEKAPSNPFSVGLLESEVWDKMGDTLFVIYIGADSGDGEAYECEARKEKESRDREPTKPGN